LKPFLSKARPDSWEELSVDDQARLVSLADLLRRIPELQLLIEETLGREPLSFHIAYADQNDVERSERMQQHTAQTGEMVFDVPITTPERTTYISILPHGQKLTADFLNSLGLPLKNIRLTADENDRSHYFVGDFTHPSEKVWWEYIETYKSGYSGTSLIVPFWG
jgi:hypothetical protein